MTDDAKQEHEAVLTASEKEQLLDYVRWVVCPCCEGAAVNYPPSQGCIVCGQDGRVLNSTANRIGDLLERYKLTLHQPQTDALKMVRDALEMRLGELYTPKPVCTCHIDPPCRDCVDYGSTREAIKWGNKALAALKELSK
jgi:hypothetical protein